MKTKFLLTFLPLFTLLFCNAKATETEPNNTKAQANTLTLNGNNSGAIASGDVDWWKVTTNADGRLRITLSALNGADFYAILYNNDGTSQLGSTIESYSNNPAVLNQDGLAPGTYFIKIFPYSTSTGSYTLADSLFTPAQANDAEPNNYAQQAIVLPLNGKAGGHLDYSYNGVSDNSDWYKVTTTADGLLRVTLSALNGADFYAILYDKDTTTQIGNTIESYSNNAAVLSADGLAAGTYYIHLYPYSTSFGTYTLADSLFKSTLANDVEPNDAPAQAIALTLNTPKTGHLGYFYNNHRDTSDWYKITTAQDGLLRISLTTSRNSVYSNNTLDVNMYLYDKDGTTQLGYTEVYNAANPATGTLTVDGLAAGTYYVKLQNYYVNSEFANYKISDSLFTSAIANDAEPNGTIATADSLPLNGPAGGHLGYYSNHQRDTSDWYKVTTTQDGLLQLSVTTSRSSSAYSSNPLDVNVYLYDNDGATQLGYAEIYNAANPTTGTLKVDRLAAGTYYIKLQNYNIGSQFTDYILKDSLLTYNANDKEPDNIARQASTVPANGTSTGHINFTGNGNNDVVDWFKINYTGAANGSMNVTYTLLPHLLDNTLGDLYFDVYKDTAASAISHTEIYTTPNNPTTITLSSLQQGYYYIKVYPYSTSFSAYSIKTTFTQKNKAKIVRTGADTAVDCSATNSISYKCTGSHSPYKVQLYRFGVAYNGTRSVGNSNVFTFTDLPDGVYYAKAYGDGATGTAFGLSDTIAIMPKPTGLTTTNITKNTATLNWTVLSCADYYVIQYKKASNLVWQQADTSGSVGSYQLTHLVANTAYQWRIQAVDTMNNIAAQSAFTDTIPFTTKASGPNAALIADGATANLQTGNAVVYPNPASSVVHVQLGNRSVKNNQQVAMVLRDVNGKAVWSTQQVTSASINIDVSKLANGVYYLQIVMANKITQAEKIVVLK